MTAKDSLSIAGSRISTGFERLDEALQGGFLPGSAVIVTASPAGDVPVVLRRFIEEASRHNRSSLLVTRSLSSAKTTAPSEITGLMILVCGEAVTPAKGVIGGKNLDNLTELSIQISGAVGVSQPERIVLGMLSDALLRHKALQTRKWLSELLSKLRSRGITTLALINPSMHPREEMEAILDLFDGNLEISEKTLRVKWMHQIDVAHKEVSLLSLTGLGPTPNSVAVIDFSNLTYLPEIDWLSGGIAETVTVDLKKISSLKVVSRERVSKVLQPYGGLKVTEEQIIDLGTSLGVRWIVWGGYQKIGNNLRITAHFTEVSTGDLVGSAKLDGTMDDVFNFRTRL